MTALSTLGLTELDLVQNPVIGAYLIWQFALGYQEDGAEAVSIPLVFLVLPVLLHRQTFDEVVSTRKASGLPLFAAKFDKEREILMSIHERAIQLRPLSLQSIGVAATSKLVRVDYESAQIHGYPLKLLDVARPKLPERLKGFASAAGKLGYWFSKFDLAQVASTLRVDF
ncbi:DUF6521 family protein (plasmid) [Tistrella mobilis]|uniref:three component ABC system middle component n=1 Tax=Tistrella mobilis TaxID=171437 RepID=UPI0035593359